MASYDHDAIYKAYPDAATIDDSTGVFKADGSKITIVQSNVDAARVELNKLQYQTDRISIGSTIRYPSIATQLDQLYHDMADGKLGAGATTGSWYVGITSVKIAHPKP